MKDQDKTRDQRIGELNVLSRRIHELEASEVRYKRSEEALRESEEKYRRLVESTADWVWTCDTEARQTFANNAVQKLLGYAVQEILGVSAFSLMHPDEREWIQKSFRRAKEKKKGWEGTVVRWLHKDGSTRYLETTAQPILDSGGNLVGFSGIDRDITERKLAEEAIRENEQRFRAVFETARDSIFIKDRSLRYTHVNPAMERLYGIPSAELVGRSDQELLGDEAAAPMAEVDKRALGGEVIEQERSKPVKGVTATFHVIKVPMLNAAGKVMGLCGIARDITRRKRREERIQKLNSLKEALLGSDEINEKLKRITEGVIEIFDADFARIWMTKACDLRVNDCFHATVADGPHACRFRNRCLHLTSSSGRYTRLDGFHRRVPYGCYKIGRVAAGEDPKFLTNEVARDPNVHDHAWAEKLGLASFAGYRLLAADGQPIGVLALFSKQPILAEEDGLLEALANTTAHVIQTEMAEKALRESEEKYRLLVKNLPSIVYRGYKDWSVDFIDEKIELLTGYSMKDFNSRRMKWSDLIVREDIETVRGAFIQALKTERSYVREYRIRTRAEEILWIQERGQILCDATGEIEYVSGVFFDITESKRAEEELRQSEKRFRALSEAAFEAIAFHEKGVLLSANDQFYDMFGYSPDELFGKQVIPLTIAPESRDFMRSQIETGSGIPYEAIGVRKDGTRFQMEIRAKDLEYQGRKVRVGVLKDITERKVAEERIQASLKEKEVLLREIHHRVKNNLQIISSLLELTRMRTHNQEASELLADSRARVHNMALIHMQLYQTERFDQINLTEHTRQLVNYLIQTYTDKARTITPVVEPSDVTLTLNQAIPSTLVLNELVSNAFKHAFRDGEEGKIHISIQRTPDDMILITVKDDGMGIPEEFDIDVTSTLGFKLVKNLVQEQLDGSVNIGRKEGTEIMVKFAISQEE